MRLPHRAASPAATRKAWLIADLPFGSYQSPPEQALRSAARADAGRRAMVKLEGGGWTADVVRFLVERGIPVCAHLGLTPQSVHALGGYRVQGRDEAAAATLRADARALAEAGAAMLVLECVPAAAGRRDHAPSCRFPTIGIGAGPHCDGQVLVLHDMLGLTRGHRRPRFVKDFIAEGGSVAGAVQRVCPGRSRRQLPGRRTLLCLTAALP